MTENLTNHETLLAHQPSKAAALEKPAQNALVETPQRLGFLTSTHGVRNR